MSATAGLTRHELAILISYSLALFGVSLVSGRPLTLHESVLPQSSREMLADHDWIVPKKGGEPWLESPPLPQWCTVTIASVIGRCDAEWIVRLGPVLVGTLCVCLTAWMASVWYGNRIGLLSGLMLATCCEFTRYAWLAEDEIYLCGLVTAAIAWFVKLEFVDAPIAPPRSLSTMLFCARPWSVVIFFALLGATNLAKGLIFGTAMAAIPMLGWLIWNMDAARWQKYVWVWGWLLFVAILAAWPLASIWREPGVLDVWRYDLGGRLTGEYHEINQPVWYYAANLPWMIAPWTLLVPFGIVATWPDVKSDRCSPARFLWAWAVLVPLAFSIPGGKHHHYLLHALAPWAVLSALGAERCLTWLSTWPRWLVHPVSGVVTVAVPAMIILAVIQVLSPIPGPFGLFSGLMIVLPISAYLLTWGLHHPDRVIVGRTVFAALFFGYAGGHWYAGQYVDTHRHDVALLRRTNDRLALVHQNVIVDLSRSPLSGFLELFYLPADTTAVHDISVLDDDRLPDEFLLLTRAGNFSELKRLGEVNVIDRSTRPLKPDKADSRLTLLQVRLSDNLPRRSLAGLRVSPMEAMLR